MLIYQDIYDVLRKEKYNEVLQKLPKDFFVQLAAYLAEKKEQVSKDSNLFSESIKMARKQLDNTISIIREIIDIRQRKVLSLAFTAAKTGVSKKDTENLTEHEKKLFEVVVKELEENESFIRNNLDGQEKKSLKNILIRFKEDVPAFIDQEGNELGPFKRGDIVNLTKEIVEILLEENKVAKLEEE